MEAVGTRGSVQIPWLFLRARQRASRNGGGGRWRRTVGCGALMALALQARPGRHPAQGTAEGDAGAHGSCGLQELVRAQRREQRHARQVLLHQPPPQPRRRLRTQVAGRLGPHPRLKRRPRRLLAAFFAAAGPHHHVASQSGISEREGPAGRRLGH